jgi:hypothetical protein
MVMARSKSTAEAPATKPGRSMTAEHKAALAQGRLEGRVVRDYLDALRAAKPRRGRKRTADTIKKRLEVVDVLLVDASPIDELRLVQERRDLTEELTTVGTGVDLGALEGAFVQIAANYGARQGISYSSWREIGVPAAVLKQAGIARTA